MMRKRFFLLLLTGCISFSLFAMQESSGETAPNFVVIKRQLENLREQENSLLAFINLLERRLAAKGLGEQRWLEYKKKLEVLKNEAVTVLSPLHTDSIKKLAQHDATAVCALGAYGSSLVQIVIALEELVHAGASSSSSVVGACQTVAALDALIAENARRISCLKEHVEKLGLTLTNRMYRGLQKFMRGDSLGDFIGFLGARAAVIGVVYYMDYRFERFIQASKPIECRALRSSRWIIGEIIDAVFKSTALQVARVGAENIGSVDHWLAGDSLDETIKKPFAVDIPALTYDKVLHLQEQKQRLERLVCFIVDSQRAIAKGDKPIQAAVFIGKPGTGKTLLSKALAGEASKRSLQQCGNDAKQIKYIEVSHKAIKDFGLLNLIGQAQQESPCILLLDELDKLLSTDKNLEADFLQVLDGFDGVADPSKPIIIIATANSAAPFSQALLREGRLGKPVLFTLPTCSERSDFIKAIVSFSESECANLALRTAGCTYKDLETMIRRTNSDGAPHKELLTNAHEHITHEILGIERTLSDCSNHVLAHRAAHQAGHVLLFLLLNPEESLDVVTLCAVVLPGNEERQFGACITYKKDEGDLLETEEDVHKKLSICLAGQVAERQLLTSVNCADRCTECDAIRARELAAQLCGQLGDLGKKKAKEIERLMSEKQQYVQNTLNEEKNATTLQMIIDLLKTHKTIRMPELVAALACRTDGALSFVRGSKERELTRCSPGANVVLASDSI